MNHGTTEEKNHHNEKENDGFVPLLVFRQAHGEEEMQKVMPKVQEWTIKEAKDNGWDDARFIGSQCLLENKFGK